MALYRKYRGLSFGDIVGQSQITDVLQKAIKSDRISHAYLFTGPRGVGKTSVARILAHAINGIEYRHEDNHIDIIEIDAASNRRIDEIRDLREKSHIAPVSAKYKVYIIDEVHMLTKEAFNALLKTLEEPPAHVVFILATTEAHKLPQTIISRTQRHTFRPIGPNDAEDHLASIAKKEKIDIEPEALKLIASYGEGSFRDAIGLLDQVSALDAKPITADDVRSTLGLGSPAAIESLLESVFSSDHEGVVEKLTEFSQQGIQPELLSKQITATLQSSDNYFEHLDLVAKLLEVPGHNQPSLKLELSLLGYAGPAQATSVRQASPALTPKPAPRPAPAAKPVRDEPKIETPQPEPAESKSAQDAHMPQHDKASKKLSGQDWSAIVASVKAKNSAIASILRSCDPTISDAGDEVTVYVRFAFHEKKLSDQATRALIDDAMNEVLGGIIDMKIEIDPSKVRSELPKDTVPDSDDLADSIINTFGGGEKVNI